MKRKLGPNQKYRMIKSDVMQACVWGEELEDRLRELLNLALDGNK
jgi:hypothetical protein